jgi:hypothetical protein
VVVCIHFLLELNCDVAVQKGGVGMRRFAAVRRPSSSCKVCVTSCKQLSLQLQVSVIPLTCPRSTVTIQATGTGVSLCRCENVWLSAVRQARGTVTLDSLACGAATTTAQILQAACSLPPMTSECREAERIRRGRASERYNDRDT